MTLPPFPVDDTTLGSPAVAVLREQLACWRSADLEGYDPGDLAEAAEALLDQLAAAPAGEVVSVPPPAPVLINGQPPPDSVILAPSPTEKIVMVDGEIRRIPPSTTETVVYRHGAWSGALTATGVDMPTGRGIPMQSEATADEPAPVPPPVDALLKAVERYCGTSYALCAAETRSDVEAVARASEYEQGIFDEGIREGRRQATEERTEEARGAALSEAYRRLREHALGLRSGFVFTNAQERAGEAAEASREGLATGSDGRWREKALGLRSYARGVDGAARHIAEMLGVEEHEIERPVATDG